MLTERQVQAAKPDGKPRKIFDERGLYLKVEPNGSKLWRHKYAFAGVERLISYGEYPEVPLKKARERRDESRRLLADGVDPSAKRKADKTTAKFAQTNTFGAVAADWLASKLAKYSPATEKKARWTIDTLLKPLLGKPIANVTDDDVLAVLRRLEARGKHETAQRTKARCSEIFRFAKAHKRVAHNPVLDILPEALTRPTVRNHPSIKDPKRIGQLLRAIDAYHGQPTTECALRLAPLLFVRPGELRGARWEEFDLDAEQPQWRIPAERMKMGEQHVVPLAHQAVAILRDLQPITGPKGYVFPSLRGANRPMSENSITSALRNMGYAGTEQTWHGFRSMASTCLNELGWHPDLIELQLAHAERNKVRAAYNKSQRLAERRKMMKEWADYLDGLKARGEVVPIRQGAR